MTIVAIFLRSGEKYGDRCSEIWMSPERRFRSQKRECRQDSSVLRNIGTICEDNYALIAANARDGARIQPLEICSTQSTGYDTTAVNSIASAYGIDKVFTVSQAKSNFYLAHNDDGKLPSDDGGEICTSLGLNFIRLNRRAFVEEFDDEYLFYCALHHNQDANLKDIAKHVSKASLLLTGTYG